MNVEIVGGWGGVLCLKELSSFYTEFSPQFAMHQLHRDVLGHAFISSLYHILLYMDHSKSKSYSNFVLNKSFVDNWGGGGGDISMS